MSYPFYIVIASHGRGERLRRTLQSLAACQLPVEFRGVIIVENGTKFDIEDITRLAPGSLQIRYLYNSAASKSEALNLAINFISDPSAFIFFTDDDITVEKDSLLQTYAQAAVEYGPGHYFGGAVFPELEVVPPKWLLPCMPLSVNGWYPEKHEAIYYFLGCNWGGFLSDLKSIGAFDRNFGPGSLYRATGQERNMQIRMFRAGLIPVYLDNARIQHYVPQNRCSFSWTLYRNYKNGVGHGLSETSTPFKKVSSQNKAGCLHGLLKKSLCYIQMTRSIFAVACRMICKLAFLIGHINGSLIRKYLVQRT